MVPSLIETLTDSILATFIVDKPGEFSFEGSGCLKVFIHLLGSSVSR